jgi:hypothetical protein
VVEDQVRGFVLADGSTRRHLLGLEGQDLGEAVAVVERPIEEPQAHEDQLVDKLGGGRLAEQERCPG